MEEFVDRYGFRPIKIGKYEIEEQLADAEAQGVSLIDKTPRKGAEGLTTHLL